MFSCPSTLWRVRSRGPTCRVGFVVADNAPSPNSTLHCKKPYHKRADDINVILIVVEEGEVKYEV